MSNTTNSPRRSMRERVRRHSVVLALALSLTGAGAVTVAGADSSPPNADRGDQTEARRALHFDVRFSPFNVIDVPPVANQPGDYRPGDYAVFSDRLVNGDGKTVGTQAGSGLITKVRPTGAQVYFTMAIRLRHGQIAAQGVSTMAPNKRLAVVGGTGSYTGAQGHLDLTEDGDGTGTLSITLR